jgi:putative heme-binding domain-containing protein
VRKRDVTWGIVTKAAVRKIGFILIFFGAIGFGAIGTALCQDSNGENSTTNSQAQLRGKRVLELQCATCHGLDGLGGEHAPDIIRQTEVKTISDQALLNLIHDGIPQAGMPGFPDMSKEDGQALIDYLRFLQGRSGGNSMAGDPVRGRDIFFGEAGCAACHGRGQSISEDLTGFARDHEAGEIREAIVRPTGTRPEQATAVERDGRKFSGMIRNEDNASLQLQDGDGRFYLLMKSSLVSIDKRFGEPMPADYGQRLNATELNDLIGYILREARASEPRPSQNQELRK